MGLTRLSYIMMLQGLFAHKRKGQQGKVVHSGDICLHVTCTISLPVCLCYALCVQLYPFGFRILLTQIQYAVPGKEDNVHFCGLVEMMRVSSS